MIKQARAGEFKKVYSLLAILITNKWNQDGFNSCIVNTIVRKKCVYVIFL